MIPKNHIWIEGDNKFNSKDSRLFGPISNELVLGIVRYRVWPFIKF
jgi:type IV secretory pathway protease TraF